jgi:hypothetical protein
MQKGDIYPNNNTEKLMYYLVEYWKIHLLLQQIILFVSTTYEITYTKL